MPGAEFSFGSDTPTIATATADLNNFGEVLQNIEHDTVEAVASDVYGTQTTFVRRAIG